MHNEQRHGDPVTPYAPEKKPRKVRTMAERRAALRDAELKQIEKLEARVQRTKGEYDAALAALKEARDQLNAPLDSDMPDIVAETLGGKEYAV